MMLPFPGGIEAVPNATLIFSVVAAIGYAFSLSRPPSLRRSAVKTLAIGLLALLAFARNAPLLLVGALGLSAAADALSSQPDAKISVAGFAAGVAAFLSFGLLFLAYGRAGLLTAEPWRPIIGAAMIALTVMAIARFWGRLGRHLRSQATVDALALLFMALPALTTTPAIIAGTMLLIGSSVATLVERQPTSESPPQYASWPYTVWILRYAGHLAITLSAVLG